MSIVEPKVYVQRFWMGHHGHANPKRSILWSTSPSIKIFDLGKLVGRARRSKVPSAKQYRDKAGKRCFQGTPQLKGTGRLGMQSEVVS